MLFLITSFLQLNTILGCDLFSTITMTNSDPIIMDDPINYSHNFCLGIWYMYQPLSYAKQSINDFAEKFSLFTLKEKNGKRFFFIAYLEVDYFAQQFNPGVIFSNEHYQQNVVFNVNNFEVESKWRHIHICVKVTPNSNNRITTNIFESNNFDGQGAQMQTAQIKNIDNSYLKQIQVGGEILVADTSKTNVLLVNSQMLGKHGKLQILNQDSDFLATLTGYINYITSKLPCSMPVLCSQGQQIVDVTDGIQQLDGTKILYYGTKYTGGKYTISGWSKLDPYKQILNGTSNIVQLMRVSLYKIYQDDQQIGDRVFLWRYLINKIPKKNGFYIATYNIIFPDISTSSTTIDDEWTNQSEFFEFAFYSWHYFQIQYGVSDTNFNTQFKIFFQMDYSVITHKFLSRLQGNEVELHFSIGGDTFVLDNLMYGYVSNIQLTYCNSADVPFQKVCHFSCQTCDGPTADNCILCPLYSQSHRKFLELSKGTGRCTCDKSYFNIDGQQNCVSVTNYFNYVELKETTNNNDGCEYAEFLVVGNTKTFCQPCPGMITGTGFYCADCLAKPKTWYKNPVCTFDYILYDPKIDSVYENIDRSPVNYEYYLINEDKEQLELCFGCLGEQLVTYTTNQTNYYVQTLSKLIQIECKQCYYYDGFTCKTDIHNCDKCDNNFKCTGCSDGYVYDSINNRCLKCLPNCKKCQFNSLNSTIACTSCPDRFTLIGQNCVQCGTNCQVCGQNTITLSTKQEITFLKCYKCIDVKKYFLSLDQINCYLNEIPNCQIAFQQVQGPITSSLANSFDIFYQPISFQDNVVTYCALCEDGYTNHERLAKCEDKNSKYYESIIFQSNSTIITAINSTTDNSLIDIEPEVNATILNCAYVIQNYSLESVSPYNAQDSFCHECVPGYYANSYSGNCIKCPSDQNCRTCQHQYTVAKDSWKWAIRSFYHFVLNTPDKLHSYLSFAQGRNTTQYSVVCTTCPQGYELYQQQCIIQCPDNCKKCKIVDSVNICIECANTIEGQMQSVVNNTCILCPNGCPFCRPQSVEELQAINPYFNPDYTNLTYFSNICLKQFSDLSQYYDTNLGLFVDCTTPPCIKQVVFSLNVYCDNNQYQSLYNALSDSDKVSFVKKNVRFSDLFSNNDGTHFIDLEGVDLFSYLTQKAIKQANFKFNLIYNNQKCSVPSNGFLLSRFRQNVYTLRTMSLEIYGDITQDIEILDSLSIYDFNSISLYNIKFKSNSKSQLLNVGFTEKIDVLFDNIYLSGNTQQKLQFIIQNPKVLTLNKITFDSISLKNSGSLFGFLYNITDITSIDIIINTVLIKSSQFVDTILFDFPTNILRQKIQISSITIEQNVAFTNSKLFNVFSENTLQEIDVKIIQLSIKNTQITSSNLIDLQGFSTVILENILIQQCTLKNSVLFLLSQFQFKDLIVQKNAFQISILISNEGYSFTNSNSTNYKLINTNLDQNSYTSNKTFINIIQLFQEQQLTLDQLSISNNFLILTEDNQDVAITSQQSNIFLQCNYITISNVQIVRYIGYPEFTLIDSNSITIQNIEVSINPSHYVKVLHSSSDCVSQIINEKQFTSIFFILNLVQLNFNQLNFYNIISLNKPIIFIKSQNTIIVKQNETITFSNSQFQNITLLQTIVSEQQSIIQIISEQNQYITMSNLQFFANHQNSYATDLSYKSSATINIGSTHAQVQLYNSQFNSNLVTNSLNSILVIKSDELTITECQFKNSNQYNFDLIKKYFIWGFDTSILYSEDFAQTYQIQSQGGSGQFSINSLIINNTIFENSVAQKGGGFYVETLGNGIIKLSNIKFTKCSTIMKSDQSSYGGALYIESSQSDLNLLMLDTLFNQTSSRIEGGALYIKPSVQTNIINLTNIDVQESHSLYSSFFRVAQTSNQAIRVYINDIRINNSMDGYLHFLGNIEKITETEILNQFYNYLFIMESGYFQLENLIIQSFGYGIFYFQDLIQVEIINSQIKNVEIIVQNLFHIKLNQLQYSQLTIDSVLVSYISLYKETSKQTSCTYFTAKKLLSKCTSQLSTNQSIVYRTNSTYQDGIAYCHLNLISSQTNTEQSIFQIDSLQTSQLVSMSSITFYKINCQGCVGLIQATEIKQATDRSLELNLKQIIMEKNTCGSLGCIIILQSTVASSLQKINQQTRLLESLTTSSIYNKSYTVVIEKSKFTENTAQVSGILLIDTIQILINQCTFLNNIATGLGGAVTFLGNFVEQLGLYNTVISENQATAGGGLFVRNYILNDPSLLNLVFLNNDASVYGSDIAQDPYQLTLSLNKGQSVLEKEQIINNSSQIVDQIVINPYTIIGQTSKVKYMMLPSGQKLSDYQYFDDANLDYIPYNLSLRIIPLNKQGDRIKKLSSTRCNISGRLLEYTSEEPFNLFSENYTDPTYVTYNDTTQDYNLDSLTVMFDPDLNSQYILQLAFKCDSIKIPMFSDKSPFQFQGYNLNYQLWLNVQTFQCQRGEQKKSDDGTCIPCNAASDQFSVEAGVRCSIKDSLTMESVSPAQIKLRPGYWRAYLSSIRVDYCLNLPINCEGGWNPGDKSCFDGHIGALCEQCDIYNTRGDGEFSTSTTYKCGSCKNVGDNTLKIIFISIWTIISIFMSVRGSVDSIEALIKTQRLQKLGIAVHEPKSGYDAVLIKVITNYFQIVGTITSFQLQIPSAINTTFTSVGNPVETMSYSLDCLLVHMSEINIIYFRMIWSLIMPLFYLGGFFILYGMAIIVGIAKRNLGILTTALIYMYIFMQPTLIGGFISLLSFRQIGGIYWVQGNVAYVYNTSQHFRWLATFVMPSLLVLGCIIPLYMYISLYNIKNNLASVESRKKLGYLYNEYRKETYYWEVIKIVQKGLIIMMLTFYQDLIVIKAALIFIIVFVYQILTKTKKPYQFKQLNDIDTQSTIICGTSIVIAMTIYSATLTNNQEIVWPFYIFLIILNGYFCLILVLEVLIVQIEKNMELIDKIRDKINAKFPDLMFKSKYHKIILENSQVRKARIRKRFRMIKGYLFGIVRNRQHFYGDAPIIQKDEEGSPINDDINSECQISPDTMFRFPKSAKIYPEPTKIPIKQEYVKPQPSQQQGTWLGFNGSNKEFFDD